MSGAPDSPISGSSSHSSTRNPSASALSLRSDATLAGSAPACALLPRFIFIRSSLGNPMTFIRWNFLGQ
jgi:hypothetical protein